MWQLALTTTLSVSWHITSGNLHLNIALLRDIVAGISVYEQPSTLTTTRTTASSASRETIYH
ncbi:RxLR-like protein [Plasmopara halstedii]|uniref:RxLR-like protein n=1 Tax=Plasmopara halstedii TaxID=4781 RepID=A0A0P1AYG3_PLAHL|nr:RxLR-like protein [Plasmopara halstedii]CEG46766.1 RxLR-like protein [Plasmopara halstedii]|eukprot:XP_024583135.1 RxLR-like protein [Plasmopara halstedii]